MGNLPDRATVFMALGRAWSEAEREVDVQLAKKEV